MKKTWRSNPISQVALARVLPVHCLCFRHVWMVLRGIVQKTKHSEKDQMKDIHCLTHSAFQSPISSFLLPKPKSICLTCAHHGNESKWHIWLYLREGLTWWVVRENFSSTECEVLKNFVPFYNFPPKNIPLKHLLIHWLFTGRENGTLIWNYIN